MADTSRYDAQRGRRYKKWWSTQKGPPQGQLIKVPPEVWTGVEEPAAPRKRSPAGGE